MDTNGSHPGIIEALIEASLVDYVAMDIKTVPEGYAYWVAENIEPESVLSSIRIVMAAPIDYEFRTTCVKPLIDQDTNNCVFSKQ